MNTAFLTETKYQGKWPKNFANTRTEIAWQITLDSDHFNIYDYEQVKDYEVVFVIFPKGSLNLNIDGTELIDKKNWASDIFSSTIIQTLKKQNKKVCFVQEGPGNLFNDYSILDQFNFYNQLAECDIIFAHNEFDTHFYKGLFPQTAVFVIPTLMIINENISSLGLNKENKAIIGGNFSHWYGGFQSYVVATEFDCPIFAPSMHCKRKGEEAVPNLTHLPYMVWNEWIRTLSNFKYAVHLMPTIAAGTFSLNCAYLGIPCIGNENVDTQSRLFPELSVNVSDIHTARFLALQLKDKDFYDHISYYAKKTALDSYYTDTKKWLEYMNEKL